MCIRDRLQLLFTPALLLAISCDLVVRPKVPASLLVCSAFLVSTLPFARRAIKKDPIVGLLSPALLAVRACAQSLGVAAGLIYACRKLTRAATESHA